MPTELARRLARAASVGISAAVTGLGCASGAPEGAEDVALEQPARSASTGVSFVRSPEQLRAAASADQERDPACCRGRNACKGKGNCAVEGEHGCRGMNACKGRGGCSPDECAE